MKSLLTVLLILSQCISYSQKKADSADLILFERAIDHYNNKNLDSALAIWSNIVDTKIGQESDIYANAFFNIGVVYMQQNEKEKAKALYKRILTADVRDGDETGQLMEPHTNYKHKAAMSLARLYYQDSNFKESLHWIGKADSVYRYWGFEGSATNVSKKQASLLSWKVHLLEKLNRKEEAIHEIIQELLYSNNLENFFSEEEEILLTMIDKPVFKAELDKSIDELKIESIDNNTWSANIKFRNYNYRIPVSKVRPPRNQPHYWKIYFLKEDQKVDEKMFQDYIRQRSFYKKL